MLLAPLLLRPFGDPGGDFGLAVSLARLLFPIVVLLGLTGVVVGILNSYDEFTVPALTPVFWNLAIIVGLVIGVPRMHTETAQLYVYAGSILVGTLIQFLLPLPWLRGRDGRLQLVLDWRDPAVHRMFKLMIPVTRRPRPDQRQRRDRRAVRVEVDRPGAGAGRDRQGLPPLHAPAGDVLGRRRDRALPAPCAPGDARRRAGLPAAPSARGLRQIGVPADPGRRSSRPCWPSRSCASSTSAASSPPTRHRSSRAHWRRSRSGSSSTAGC